MTSRYYLRSFGCQMNEHDAERIRALLEAEGLERADEPDDADVLVYNTCTVRKSADDRLAGHLGTAARLKREDPARVVLVTGCLPQAEQAGFFARFPFVDGALGPQNLHRLPELLQAAVEPADAGPAGFFEDGPTFSGSLAARRERPFQAWMQVMSGCTNFCSYCIVPYVRGPERSRGVDELVAEAERLVADGVREITLLGQNVNAYGRDLKRGGEAGAPRFAELLTRLDAVPGLERLRFMTSHPKDLGDDLVAAVAGAAQRVRARAPAGPGRLRPRARRHAPRVHVRAVSRAGAGAPCGRSRREHHHGPHRRLSRGDGGGLRADRSTSCARPPSTRRSRSSTRRARAPPPRTCRTRCRPTCAGSAWSA